MGRCGSALAAGAAFALMLGSASALGVAHAQDATASPGIPPAADAPPVTGAGADVASTGAAPPAAAPPKVAVVVAGDPDPGMRALARRVEEALASSTHVALPADAALRDALRGEAGADDDGLSGARAERRALGLGEARDRPHLARLAALAGAVALAVTRARPDGQAELVVADVARGALFEGELSLAGTTPDAIVAFVAPRARAAARARATAATQARRTTARARTAPAAATTAGAPPDERSWLERNWALLAAGAGLVALVVVVLLTRGGNDAAPGPVLRFVPGDRP